VSESVPVGGFTVADASIHTLVEALTHRHLDGVVDPSIIRIRLIPTGLEVGLRPLDGDHPSVWLTGHRFADDIDAVGVVTGGRVFSTDDPSATLGRASVGVAVSRRGEVASTALSNDGAPSSGKELSGLAVDLLKRSIGVATPPPPCDADVLFAQAWLISISDFAHIEARIPSWSEIVRLHPAVEILALDDDVTLTQHELQTILVGFGDLLSWRELRRMLDEHRLEVPGLNPGEGKWFDDGSFARRLLAERPPLGRLRDDVLRLLPFGLGRRVSATLDAAGIPHTSWPDPSAELRESA